MAIAVVLVACYSAPTSAPRCQITCTDECPGDLTCKHGYCVGEADTCEPTFRQTSAGTGFACALDTQDLLWCWGANTNNQLEASATPYVSRATQIGKQRWDAVSAGGGHICGLRDGHLYCWGRNDRGQISDLISGNAVEPYEIAAPKSGVKWSVVAAGYDTTCAIAAGSLYCWGANDTGQLGTGDRVDIGTPTAIKSDITDWIAVDSASYTVSGVDYSERWGHACAISTSAGVYCWGRNKYGELGDGTYVDSDVPVAAALPSPATSISVGRLRTCATTESKELYCWGWAGDRGLGDPNIVSFTIGTSPIPIRGSDLTGWTHVDSNEWLSCALRDGEVWCWGWTGGGGLGNGVFGGYSWGKVASGASELSVGWSANIDDDGNDAWDLDLNCIIVDGKLQCWGDNRFGQLGQGGATMQPTPSEVTGGHRFSSIAAGGSHVCGIENGNLLCWGSTSHGQANGVIAGTSAVPCGSAPGLSCNVPVPAQVSFMPTADQVTLGRYHSCARAGGAVTCWGDNAYGQLGSSTATSPATIPGTWTQLFDTGEHGNCGTINGQTQCWGAVTGAPTPPQNIAAFDTITSIGVEGVLDGGSVHSFGCVLDAGELWCFGGNRRGQFGNGNGEWYCGDLVCSPGEPNICLSDCPTGVSTCGNGACDQGETAGSCSADCGTGPLTRLGRKYLALSVGWPLRTSDGITSYLYNPYACGVTADGGVECWGRSRRGAAVSINDLVPTPMTVPGLAGCTAVSASDYHTCAICGGDIHCWGDHRFGGVGAGAITKVAITEPRKLDVDTGGEPWVQLVSGYGFSCARTQGGRAFCWGFSQLGALGSGGAASPLPIAVQLAL